VVDEDHIRRLLSGYWLAKNKPTKDKVTVAGPLSSEAEHNGILLLEGEWNGPFLSEAENFDGSPKKKDDQVDASAAAYNELQGNSLGYASAGGS
jgi:phage terminase large subunit-like protein